MIGFGWVFSFFLPYLSFFSFIFSRNGQKLPNLNINSTRSLHLQDQLPPFLILSFHVMEWKLRRCRMQEQSPLRKETTAQLFWHEPKLWQRSLEEQANQSSSRVGFVASTVSGRAVQWRAVHTDAQIPIHFALLLSITMGSKVGGVNISSWSINVYDFFRNEIILEHNITIWTQ